MVKRERLDYKKATDRDRFNIRSLLAYEKFLNGDRSALPTIRKFAISEIAHESESTIPGLLPTWAGPMVQPERAGLWVPNSVSNVVKRSDDMPSLKVPDVDYVLKRAAAGKPVGIVSSIDNGTRVEVEQLLLNEPMRVGQSVQAWAVAKMGKPSIVHGPDDIAPGSLDPLTEREFIERCEDGDTPLLYYPLDVTKSLERPYAIRSAESADRVMSPIDKVKEEARSILAVLNPEHLRAMKDETIEDVDSRLHQLFEKFFGEDKSTALDGIPRDELVQGHGFLVVELKRRDKKHETHDHLTRESDELRKNDGDVDEQREDFRVRVRNVDDFDEESFATRTIRPGKQRVIGVFGNPVGSTQEHLQSLRFPKKDGWTKKSVRDYLKNHPNVAKGSTNKVTAAEVRAMPIGEVVDDAEWQELRSGLRGKWTTDPKGSVAQLTEYLQSFNDPFRLRRALNLLTGSGFRTGRISHPSISSLRDKVRDAWNGLLEREKETGGGAVQRAKAAIAEAEFDGVVLKHDRVRLVKADGQDEHFVLGIVLEPETEDSQGDVYSEKEVRDAAHGFMEDARQIGYMHREMLKQGVAILENFVAPTDMNIDGQHVKKGTWLLGLRVKDASLWKQIKDGTLTGLSIGGSAVREPEEKD
jgi:hypothetical protein